MNKMIVHIHITIMCFFVWICIYSMQDAMSKLVSKEIAQSKQSSKRTSRRSSVELKSTQEKPKPMWIRYFDQDSKNYYYVNTQTNASQWEEPSQSWQDENDVSNTDVPSDDTTVINTKSKKKWIRYFDEENKTHYYVNSETQVSQWEEPSESWIDENNTDTNDESDLKQSTEQTQQTQQAPRASLAGYVAINILLF